MKSARLITTLKCHRDCEYCCNKYESIMKDAKVITDLGELHGYDSVNITGGEPCLYGDTISVIDELRKCNPYGKIYLYTSVFNFKIWSMVDGVTLSIHEGKITDVVMLSIVEAFVRRYKHYGGTYRLWINSHVEWSKVYSNNEDNIATWDRLLTSVPYNEEKLLATCPVHNGKEDLYIYEGGN